MPLPHLWRGVQRDEELGGIGVLLAGVGHRKHARPVQLALQPRTLVAKGLAPDGNAAGSVSPLARVAALSHKALLHAVHAAPLVEQRRARFAGAL